MSITAPAGAMAALTRAALARGLRRVPSQPNSKHSMNEINHSKNIISGSHIDAAGNVNIGDVTVVNLKEAAEYKALEADINELQEQFNHTKTKIEKYPDDDDFKADLIRIAEKRSQKERDLETLKTEVIKLAEDFQRIPINTERLRKARHHFENGEFAEARAVLDAEVMGRELDDLEKQEANYQEKLDEIKSHKTDKANEFLILAKMTATDFENPKRYEMTVGYFEQSIRAERNGENLFAFADFLQHHRQFHMVAPYYEKALQIYRDMAAVNPQTYLSDVALTLNNLGLLYRDNNEYEKSEAALEEALQIRRSLAAVNPQKYLSEVAMTLNNTANLYRFKNMYEKAETDHNEALKIRRYLVSLNPQIYMSDLAKTLNNLAVLYCDKNEDTKAQLAYEEALQIYRNLASVDIRTYISSVAGVLNNLGMLNRAKNEYDKSETAYKEALQIRRDLATINPQIYLSEVAMTLNNIANLHRNKKEYNKAKTEYKEALQIYRTLALVTPLVYKSDVAMTLHNLALLRCHKKEYWKAEEEYKEALQIRRDLAAVNPQIYLLDVAMTAINMGDFYQQNVPDQQKSLAYSKEALRCALPFVEHVPRAAQYAQSAMEVVKNWGLDADVFFQEIKDEMEIGDDGA